MIRYEIVVNSVIATYSAKLLVCYWEYRNDKFTNLELTLSKDDKEHLDKIEGANFSYVNIFFEHCNSCNLRFTRKVDSREMFIKEITKEPKKCDDCTLNSDFFEDGIIVFKELNSDLFTDEEIRLLNKIKRQKTKKIIYNITFDGKTDSDNMFFYKKKVKEKHWAD